MEASDDFRDMGLLLPSDVRWLDEKGYVWSMSAQENNGLLVLTDFRVDSSRYDRESVDLLIHIPAAYNDATLDMWYVWPHVKMRSGDEPDRAHVRQNWLGREWQGFSRHLPSWRAGLDDLPRFMTFVVAELQRPGDA